MLGAAACGCPSRRLSVPCCGFTVFDAMDQFLAGARLVGTIWITRSQLEIQPDATRPTHLRASQMWQAIQLVQQWHRHHILLSLRARTRRRLLWIVWSAWEIECPWHGQLRRVDRHALILSLHDWWLDLIAPMDSDGDTSLPLEMASAGAVAADRWRLLPTTEWRLAVFDDLSP